MWPTCFTVPGNVQVNMDNAYGTQGASNTMLAKMMTSYYGYLFTDNIMRRQYVFLRPNDNLVG